MPVISEFPKSRLAGGITDKIKLGSIIKVFGYLSRPKVLMCHFRVYIECLEAFPVRTVFLSQCQS